jgi:valyl-tRNA synthetase
MNTLIELVRGVRNVRTEYNVDPGHKIKAVVSPGSYRAEIEQYSYLFARLCNVGEVSMLAEGTEAPSNSASLVVSDVTMYLPLADLVDTAAECERLSKELAKLKEQVARTEAMLGNESFVARARADVVERERTRLAELQSSEAQVSDRLARLCAGG